MNNQFKSLSRGVYILVTKLFKFWLHFKPLLWLSELHALEQKHMVNGAHKMLAEVIRDKKESFATDKMRETSRNSPRTLIDHLFHHRDELSYEEIGDELYTIVGAVSRFTF